MLARYRPELVQAGSLPPYDFVLSDLAPRRQKLPRLGYTARTTFTLVNSGPVATTFQLNSLGESSGCQVGFGLTGEHSSWTELRLAPDEAVAVPVLVRLPHPPLLAPRRSLHRFTITITPVVPRPLTRSLQGQVETAPLVGPWLLTLLGLGLVGLAVWLSSLALSNRPGPAPVAAPFPRAILPAVGQALAGPAVTPVYLAGNTPPELAQPALSNPGPLTYRQMFEQVGGQYGLDWRILAEVAYQESRFNPWAIGRQSEMGLMQIMPTTWSEWAPQVGVIDPYDPYSNLQVAAAYLVYLRNYCQVRGYAEAHWMLIGYNWGPDRLQKVFDQQGGLDQVPEKPRQYALTILVLGPDVDLRRQSQLEALVMPWTELRPE